VIGTVVLACSTIVGVWDATINNTAGAPNCNSATINWTASRR
jgi:hypothetical protein